LGSGYGIEVKEVTLVSFITNFKDFAFGENVWIGLKYQDGYWQWTDKTPLDYTNYGCWAGPTTCYFMIATHDYDACGDWYGFWDKNAECNVILSQIICKYKS
jgi:hypothetical protein